MSTAQNLSLIENNVFGFENNNLSDIERLKKIENFVYGSEKQSQFSTRLSKLNTDLGIEVSALPQANNEYQQVDYSSEPVDKSEQYPIVDKLEESVLAKTYKNENIYKRLDRLEQKAYGKVSKGALSERVERLSSLMPEQQKRSEFDDYMANNDEYNYYSPATKTNTLSTFNEGEFAGEQAIETEQGLLVLEKSVLGKTYSSEPITQRLSRLEKKILYKEFSDEAEELRMERLATVVNAQKTSKVYKENRFMQHVATGVQIGGMILMFLAMIL